MRKILPLFLFLAAFFGDKICKAQDQKVIDSLVSLLKAEKEDISKVINLLSVANNLKNNDPEKSIEFGKEALQLSTKLNYKKGMGQADVHIGIALINLGEYDESLSYLSQGLEISKSADDRQTTASALNNTGLVYSNRGNYTDALKNFWGVLKMQEEIKDTKETADCYSNIGVTYEKQSKYEEAIKFQTIALKLRREIGDQQRIAASFNFIGMIYRRQGDYTAAMQNYLAALKIEEETGDKRGKAYSLEHIGIIRILQGNYSEAMKNLSASLKIFEAIKNKSGMADCYGDIGWCYGEQGKYAESLINTHAALEIVKAIGDRQDMALYYNNAGFLYNKQGNHAEAMKNLLIAVKISQEIGDNTNIAETYESIGETYSAMGNYAASVSWLNKGLKAATEISEKRIVKESYAALAKVYEKLNDPGRAYQYYKQYITTRDSLNNEEEAKKQTRLEMNYDFEKKAAAAKAEQDKKDALVAAEIKRQTLIKNSILAGIGIAAIFSFLLVRSFNRRRKTSFEKQVTEVEMKALRSQMNPHFIFNSLRSINEYIQHHKTALASEYLVKFSKLMRAILENSRQKEIVLSKEIEMLELYMQLESQRMEHPFSYTVDIDPEIDPENTLIPPMLLQPLVENSIRHGLAPKQEPGKIIIRIKKQNETIQCEVEDDGIGREVSRSVNKDLKTESYGLKITAERLAIIEQIKKIKTNLTFRDLNTGDNSTGLYVAFALPLEEAV